MSSNVHLALLRLIERAQSNPDDAELIERALFALKSTLDNTLGVIEIASRTSPASLASIPTKPPKSKFLERTECNDLSAELTREFGLGQPLRLKQLQAIARDVGTAHGLIPTQAEMRSKPGLLLWIKTNRDALEPDLTNYVRARLVV